MKKISFLLATIVIFISSFARADAPSTPRDYSSYGIMIRYNDLVRLRDQANALYFVLSFGNTIETQIKCEQLRGRAQLLDELIQKIEDVVR